MECSIINRIKSLYQLKKINDNLLKSLNVLNDLNNKSIDNKINNNLVKCLELVSNVMLLM